MYQPHSVLFELLRGTKKLNTTQNSMHLLSKMLAQQQNDRAVAEARRAEKLKADEEAMQKIPKPEDVYLTSGLYEPICFTGVQVWPILDIIFFDGTYDCFCIECGKSSTFKLMEKVRPNGYRRDMASSDSSLEETLYFSKAICARENRHAHEYVFLVRNSEEGQTLQKIGQFPSYADIHIGELKSYASVLSKQHRKELSTAIGLASHGVGVGSFVYLRRVFEALIEEAHQLATADAGWDEPGYQNMYMGQRIAALKSHLPEFMTRNTRLYSVLSKGVHQLTEEECLAAFDTVRLCIEMILGEKLERKNRAERLSAAEQALTKLASK